MRLRVSSVCVGALRLSPSRIDTGDGSGFPSDVATASLGLFNKIQDYIDSLVLFGIYISHERRVRTMRSLARIIITARSRAWGRFKINNNEFRIFLPIIQLLKIVPYYSKFYSRIISAGLVLRVNQTLIFLGLSGNQIGDDGVKDFCKVSEREGEG